MLVCGLVGFEAQRNDKRREMAQTEGDRRVHWLANYFIFRSAWNIERFFFFMSAHVCLLLSLSFHTVCHFTMLPRSSFFHAKHICSSFLISVSAALMCNMFSDSNKRNVYNISNNCVCKYHACLYCPIMFLNSITNFCFTIIHFFFSQYSCCMGNSGHYYLHCMSDSTWQRYALKLACTVYCFLFQFFKTAQNFFGR